MTFNTLLEQDVMFLEKFDETFRSEHSYEKNNLFDIRNLNKLIIDVFSESLYVPEDYNPCLVWSDGFCDFININGNPIRRVQLLEFIVYNLIHPTSYKYFNIIDKSGIKTYLYEIYMMIQIYYFIDQYIEEPSYTVPAFTDLCLAIDINLDTYVSKLDIWRKCNELKHIIDKYIPCNKGYENGINVKRNDTVYQIWREKCLERDGHKCVVCGNSESKLHVHHINGYKEYPSRRVDPDNGITLCVGCHNNYHSMYGRDNNTARSFIDFICKTKATELKNIIDMLKQ